MFYRAVTEEQTVRLRRALPVIALALVAFAVGAIVGGNQTGSTTHSLAARFVKAWARGDYAAMYFDIDAASRQATSADQFARDYQQALRTATSTGLQVAGGPRDVRGGLVAVPVRVDTRLFGTLAFSFQLKILAGGAQGSEGPAIAWSPSLAFPGLRPGEELARRTALPPRANLLARDGSILAEGSASTAADRSYPLGALASALLGEVGPVPTQRRQALEAQGVPADAIVGTGGLELALDDRLRGTPGGELLAEPAGQAQSGGPAQSTAQAPSGADRILASAVPHAAAAVRTTVSPAVQREAVTALGGQLGGVVAMEPSGQILAVAGIGLDSVQPPGSTFKMITLTSALEAHLARPHTVFPYASYSTLDGVKLNNANGENCGGTLELAFAVSCNSVFAPLGVKVGAARLVATAERFGFNHEPGLDGAAESTLPAASQIQGELDVGSTAIGQGQVQASTLEMAVVAATIADGGHRPRPTFTTPASAPVASVVATSAAVARTVRSMMIGVVREGTGTAAAIPGVVVAGKTGTAELKTQCTPPSSESASGESQGKEAGSASCQGAADEASNTDAWFAAFAPALHPRIVVGVLLVKDGAGGATAAPVARAVLESGLHSGH
jgi:peptidoglycan glycosyltransferase